jgi:hypothetical protein
MHIYKKCCGIFFKIEAFEGPVLLAEILAVHQQAWWNSFSLLNHQNSTGQAIEDRKKTFHRERKRWKK